MKGSRILLVDDEVVFTTNMSKLLTSRGYRVTAVNSGDAAIQELEKNDYDVVVLDLKMPGMDGMEVLRRIRKRWPTIPVAIVTGHGTIELAVEAMKLGAIDFIQKPFSPVEILDLARRVGEHNAPNEESDAT